MLQKKVLVLKDKIYSYKFGAKCSKILVLNHTVLGAEQ